MTPAGITSILQEPQHATDIEPTGIIGIHTKPPLITRRDFLKYSTGMALGTILASNQNTLKANAVNTILPEQSSNTQSRFSFGLETEPQIEWENLDELFNQNDLTLKYIETLQNKKPIASFSGGPNFYGSNIWKSVLPNRQEAINESEFNQFLVEQGALGAVNPARINPIYYQRMLELSNQNPTTESRSTAIANDPILRNEGRRIIGKPIFMITEDKRVYPTLILDVMAQFHSAIDMNLIPDTVGVANNFVMDGNSQFLGYAYRNLGVQYINNKGFVNKDGRLINPPPVQIVSYNEF